MIEFNISWGDGSSQDLKDIVELIQGSGMQDVRVNITREIVPVSTPKKTVIPEMRIRQIIAAIDRNAAQQKPGLSKRELVSLLMQYGSGIAEMTASVYVSNATGQGIISRTPAGYTVSPLGMERFPSEASSNNV